MQWLLSMFICLLSLPPSIPSTYNKYRSPCSFEPHSRRNIIMQRHYPHFERITPNDFLLNLINHHLNQIFDKYSKVLALRIDLSYLQGTSRHMRNSSCEMQDELRTLTGKMMQLPQISGYFWVIEWTTEGALHSHVVFYLNGQKVQKSFPFSQYAGNLWQEITHFEGKYEWCKVKDYYRDNINNVIDHRNEAGVYSLRRIISYLAKEEQKRGQLIWGYNEVPK